MLIKLFAENLAKYYKIVVPVFPSGLFSNGNNNFITYNNLYYKLDLLISLSISFVFSN